MPQTIPSNTPTIDKTIILVPARMTSTRLPGKAMAMINGVAMIVHVWRRAIEAQVGRVVVATDSHEIIAAIESHGGEAMMTRSDHPSGSDRIYEVLQKIDPDGEIELVINLQGDLPTIEAKTIRACLVPMADRQVDVATLVAEITTNEERNSADVVKMIGSDLGGGQFRALYFTRATAPGGDGPLYHHIGIYCWRRKALASFIALPPSPLELRERLEQLRVIEAGMRIDAMLVDTVPLGVDTAADLEQARAMLAGQQETR